MSSKDNHRRPGFPGQPGAPQPPGGGPGEPAGGGGGSRGAAGPSGPEPQEGGAGQGLLPALSLPKGGGAIRGIGETFSTNPATGTLSLSIPIATSPGRSGFDLSLALGYDSGVGNGPFGAPALLSDPNENRTAVELDALGMVVKTAVMGKAGEGDTLADPTTRSEVDLDQFRDHGKPVFVHTFARERHGAANPRWQETYSYSDGSGREVMKKVQAEPGPVPVLSASGHLLRNPDQT